MNSTLFFINSTSATPVITVPPSIPVITLPPLPSDFNDIPHDVRECYDSWASAHAHNAFIQGQASLLASTATLDPPTTVFERSSWTNQVCSTSPFTGKYTTLCDGLARNTEKSEVVSCWGTWTTYTWTNHVSSTTITPEWVSQWSTKNKVTLPTCLRGLDRERVCYRLHSAYSWRTEQAKSLEKTNTTQLPSSVLRAEKPGCETLRDPPPTNWTTRPCHVDVDAYQVFYWPAAPLTGSSLCMPNITRLPGGTRTIPWLPNTAVVSGFTLTSPSVYHFMSGVRVSTSIGRTKYGRWYMSPVWNMSTSIASNTVLTYPQEESEIWTVRSHKAGRGIHAHVDYDYYNGSYNADDMATVRSVDYFGACPSSKTCNHTGETISQAHFTQRAAIPIKEMLEEWDSDEFKDCEWSQQYYMPSFHNKSGMWIAPGEPWRATPILTEDEDEPEATRMAKPASTIDATITQTVDWVPETTETGEPGNGPEEGPESRPDSGRDHLPEDDRE